MYLFSSKVNPLDFKFKLFILMQIDGLTGNFLVIILM